MIDPAPEGLVLGLPGHPVVEGAAGKEGHGGEGENAQSDPPLKLVGDGDQGQAGDQAEGGHDEVDEASQFGARKLNFRGFRRFHRVHGSKVAPIERKGLGVSELANPPHFGGGGVKDPF